MKKLALAQWATFEISHSNKIKGGQGKKKRRKKRKQPMRVASSEPAW